jgi:predicted CXXCH cytochrome family protein
VRRIPAYFAAAGVVLTGAAGFLFWRAHVASQVPKQAESAYVSPVTCAGCHAEIFKSYRLTGMGRSLYRPSAENMVEDFTTHNAIYNRASDRYYTMIERAGEWYQRRHQIDYEGKMVNVVEKQIDYVIGSGNHVRSYLSRTAQGTLVELPVSWYSEKGGYWAMSPGYDRADQDDFRRSIAARCLGCHDAYPSPGQGSNLTTSEPVFGEHIPDGIDCQRCHGPGRAHVEAAGSGHASLDSIRRAIVNPGKLDRDRQMEVCMQCHLETTHFSLPGDLLRYSHQPFSYQPGQPLGDFILFFDHAPGSGYDDKFEIVNAAYRLRRSACFRSSQMTCTTCHDAHSTMRPKEAAAHFTAVCRSCHQSAHESKMPGGATSCIECHMPKRRTEDVVHAVMTDHYIQRRKPSGDLLAPIQETESAGESYHGEVSLYYPADLPMTPENMLYVDLAQVYYGANLKSGLPQFEQDLGKYNPPGPEFYAALGNAYKKAGNYNQAIHWYEEALRRQTDFRPALEELGGALLESGQTAPATPVLEKASALPLPKTGVLTNLGGAYFRQSNLDRAKQVLARALSLNPDLPEAHNFLGMVSVEQRDWPAGEQHFREAISIQPDYASAQYNLAALLAGTSRYAEAQYHFEKAIGAQPDYAEAHHHYGVLLAQLGSNHKALAELQESVRLDPGLAEAYSDLGTALVGQGQIEGAEEAYRHAIQIKPELYEAHLGLGQILAYRGNASQAREHYEEAAKSPDPKVRDAALKAIR